MKLFLVRFGEYADEIGGWDQVYIVAPNIQKALGLAYVRKGEFPTEVLELKDAENVYIWQD